MANLRDAFFSKDAPLTEEFRRMLKAGGGPYRTLSVMLFLMAGGSVTPAEIAREAGISRPLCGRNLRILESRGFVRRLDPVLGQRRSPGYVICDPLLAFGYAVVSRYSPMVWLNSPTDVCREARSDVRTYMGHAFESVVADYIRRSYYTTAVGKWEGRCDGEEMDIDVVAVTKHEKGFEVTILCECKFRNDKADLPEIKGLRRRAEAAGCRGSTRFMIASVSGFTDRLAEYAEDHHVMLVGPGKILGREAPDPLWYSQ